MPFPPRKPAKAGKNGLSKARSKPARKRRPTSSARPRKRGSTVLHACGHKEAHPFTGPKWKKAKDAEWQKSQDCTACWSLKQAEEQEAMCAVADLPELAGADRQVSWARSLRAAAIGKLRMEAWRMDQERRAKGLEPATERYLAVVLPLLLARSEASWWIDRRDGDPLEQVLDAPAEAALEVLRREAEQAIVCPF